MDVFKQAIDDYARGEHAAVHSDSSRYRFTSVDDLPLTDWQKKCVLEWFANHIWVAALEAGVWDSHCKSYDPLLFEDDDNEVHSYVFDLWDGGRHHHYSNLEQVDVGLHEELKGIILDALSVEAR